MINGDVLLIPTPAIRLGKLHPYLSLGLHSIKESAKNSRFLVEILDFLGEIEDQEFSSAVELGDAILSLFNPLNYKIIGLSTIGGVLPTTLYLAEQIKNSNPDVSIIFGGPQASFFPTETLDSFPFVDACVVGEGEITFTEMLQSFKRGPMDWRSIPGVMVRNGPYVKRELIENLDGLPVVEYDSNSLGKKMEPFIRVEALRGCYAKCKFCAASRFWEHRVRRKSPVRLVKEINHLAKTSNISMFLMIGDNFSYPKASFQKTCQAIIQEGIGFKWACALRISDLDLEDLQLLKEAGCVTIFVGIESASQDTLNRINKNINLEKTILMIKEALNLGIQISTCQIIGFPWETEKDVMNTLKQHSELLDLGVSPSDILELVPLPGAEGFPEYQIITDFSSIHTSLPSFFKDEYTTMLIQKYPSQFIQFGYYDMPNLRRSFIKAVIEASEQISVMKAELRQMPYT